MLKKFQISKSLLLLVLASAMMFSSLSPCLGKEAKLWSFGVMGDTQWTPSGLKDGKPVLGNDPEGKNPNSVSASIISQINQEFIGKGVKFVIQVGDITDWGTDEAIASRAKAAEELYDAGIGFFCMRGNHETYNNLYFRDAASNDYGIPAMQLNFPQHKGTGKNVFNAHNFSGPSSNEPGLEDMAAELSGLSYAFDYGEKGNNATFLVIDPWVTQTQSKSYKGLYVSYGYPIKAQQDWISNRLDKKTRGTRHAFVFSHQPLIAASHEDSIFGFLDSDLEDQNIFFRELRKHGVNYYIAGHDHIHQRNIIESPDGKNEIEQLICASACPKFYKSKPDDFKGWHGQKYRSTTLSQELNNIGFYIYTIDGPIVIVDYYSDENGGFVGGNKWPDGKGSLITPKFNFTKKESWSYSLNGKAFMIKQGDSYNIISDKFEGTTAKIIGGKNNNKVTDDLGKPLVKRVNTGWKKPDKKEDNLSGNVFYLSGMADTGTKATNTFALSLTYDQNIEDKETLKFSIMAKKMNNSWVNAVDLNSGGIKTFKKGPYKSSYSLGTYGIDKASNTVWAVINFNGFFLVGRSVE